MLAIITTQTGGPEVLTIQQTAVPQPQPDEILVKTTAIGINYADLLIRKGIYPKTTAIMPGEIEGIIEQTGSNVKHLHAGQKVSGYSTQGYAEYATIHASQAFVLPIDLPSGHGLLVQALTAQHLLSQAGDPSSILITAAAGGVGSFLVQLAKLKGIKTIIALTGSKEKYAFVRSLGATHAYTYGEQTNLKADVIVDAVGGETGAALIHQLAPYGTMIVYGGTAGQPTNIDVQQLIHKFGKVTGSTLYSLSAEQKQQWYHELADLITQGKLTFHITTYPFADVVKAHQAIENRTTTGRVALVV